MINVIILHGWPDKKEYYNPHSPSQSNSHWLPWLQRQLQLLDIKADTPEVPFAFNPKYPDWVKEVERFDITKDTVAVGHSMGGGFWIRYLSQNPKVHLKKLVLVAPWLNVQKDHDVNDFFDFNLDTFLFDRVGEMVILESDNDDETVTKSIEYLKKQFPLAKVVTFHNYGHFIYESMHTDKFPELLDIVAKGLK